MLEAGGVGCCSRFCDGQRDFLGIELGRGVELWDVSVVVLQGIDVLVSWEVFVGEERIRSFVGDVELLVL